MAIPLGKIQTHISFDLCKSAAIQKLCNQSSSENFYGQLNKYTLKYFFF